MYKSKVRKSLAGALKLYLLISALLIFSSFIIFNSNFINVKYSTLFLFLIVGIFSLGSIVSEIRKRPFSLQMMHWIFCFIFFFVSGFTQYVNNRFVYSLSITDSTINYVLIVIIIWMVAFYLGTRVSTKNKYETSKHISKMINTRIKYHNYFISVLAIVSLIIATYIIVQGGFNSLFSRSTADSAFESTGESMFTKYFLRNIVVYSTVITIIFYKKLRGKYKVLLVIQLLCLLVSNPILGMARFNVAIIYLGVIIIIFDNLKHNIRFFIAFLTGFIFVFPALDIFRYESIESVGLNEFTDIFKNLPNGYLTGHYDALSMVINTVNHVENFGISFGYQFLGPLLFFVPRTIWPEKPFGSGYTVRMAQGESFLNVSSPLVAEAYINFSIIGVILLGLLIGKIISYLDREYWLTIKQNYISDNYIAMIYPFLISMFFFMNRGDLMSTTSFAVSHVAVFTMLFILNNVIFYLFKK